MSDGDTIPQKEWAETLLESLWMVQWDRFVQAQDPDLGVFFDIYGWIDREADSRKDFILLRLFPESEDNLRLFTTSSSRYHDTITEILFGSVDDSNPCQRVEHTFDIENAIENDGPELATDGGQPESGLPDPLEGCRDGFKFGCAFGCGTNWTGDEFASIAKRAARHYNKEHGSDLRHQHEVVETIERGGHHIHGNVYQVERVDIYLTPFDMAERVGSIDGWLAGIESDRVCPECDCIIPNRDDRIEDDPDAPFNELWTCRECINQNQIRRKEKENKQLSEWKSL